MLKRFVVCAVLFCSLCSIISLPVAAANLSKPEPTQTASLCDGFKVDVSNANKGYIEVCRQESSQRRYKVLLCKNGGTRYCYSLPYSDGFETIRFPVSEGSGDYSLKICRQKSGTTYSVVYDASIKVKLEDELLPFLQPNGYVDYAIDGKADQLAEKLTAGCKTSKEKIDAIYSWVVDEVSYDYAFAKIATSDYCPDAEQTIADRNGICSDYAALMVAALRCSEIPAKVIVGYTGGSQCHAWVEVYDESAGSWNRMDPTYASAADESQFIMDYIENDDNYLAKYQY